jgi:hypothetical protein
MVRCYLSGVSKQVTKVAIPMDHFVIASLDEDKAVIPVWLDEIYKRLEMKLKKIIND